MTIWLVAMECASINEAGGVKDVVHGLCKELSLQGERVTLFTPRFGSTMTNCLKDIKHEVYKSKVYLCGREHEVLYTTATFRDFPCEVVLVEHLAFAEKGDIYTYTKKEESINPAHRAGVGHGDFHFLDCVLSAAVAQYSKFSPSPDVVHCQDASCALTPCYIELQKKVDKTAFKGTRCLLTIHNAGVSYHHEFYSVGDAAHNTALPREWLESALSEWRVEPFLLAAPFSTLITVSEEYAKELLDPQNTKETDNLSAELYKRKIPIEGINNGLDYDFFDPSKKIKSLLPFEYSPIEGDFLGKDACRKSLLKIVSGDSPLPALVKFGELEGDDDGVLFSFHGRLVEQKGVLVLLDAAKKLFIKDKTARLIIIAQGGQELEKKVIDFTTQHKGRVLFFDGYDEAVARLVIAAGDFLVIPSYFEPCGQTDLIAQTFGTIPISHATGGLKKVINGETGFLYSPNDARTLLNALEAAIKLKKEDPKRLNEIRIKAARAAHDKYSWHAIVRDKYLALYKKI